MRKKILFSPTEILCAILIFLCILFCYTHIDTSKEAVLHGLKLCSFSLIPSLFPYICLSDYLIYSKAGNDFLNVFSYPFRRLFRLSPRGGYAVLLGFLCGFPAGAASLGKSLEEGKITEEEAKRIMRFCNNASPSFVIAGVGGLLGSYTRGTFIFLVQCFSAALSGWLSAPEKPPADDSGTLSGSSLLYSVPEAIKRISRQTVSVACYILFFGVIAAWILPVLPGKVLPLLFSCLAEPGNAVQYLSLKCPVAFLFPMMGFCTSFSGFSVFFQCLACVPAHLFSLRSMCFWKTVQGLVSFFLLFFFSLIIG